jgi:hypothetical protein
MPVFAGVIPRRAGGTLIRVNAIEPPGSRANRFDLRSVGSMSAVPGPAPVALDAGPSSVAALGRGGRSVPQGMPAARGGNDDHLLMRRATGQLCENRSRVTGEVTSWGARFRYEGQRRYLTLEAESREEAVREMALLMFRAAGGFGSRRGSTVDTFRGPAHRSWPTSRRTGSRARRSKEDAAGPA